MDSVNTGFSYYAAGNLTNDGSFTYQWDAESRMKTGAGVTYTYNGDDRRVKKSNGTGGPPSAGIEGERVPHPFGL